MILLHPGNPFPRGRSRSPQPKPVRRDIPFDPYTATISELRTLLETNQTTSCEIVQVCLDQISKHDKYLRAVLFECPHALELAAERDRQRKLGCLAGPLHGIPILIKDNIGTHPSLGMPTSAGSYALAKSKTQRNAEIVDRMLAAGAIILGKASLSEFGSWKGLGLMSGWSAIKGQGQSAYTQGNVDPWDAPLGHSSPAGSSTGSAQAVAAGYCPVSIGTDSCGSLITPATRAALYTIRPTKGLVSTAGIMALSDASDTAGPMTKCVLDLAVMLDVLVDPKKSKRQGSYVDALQGSWAGLRVGVLNPEEWYFDETLQVPRPSATEQIVSETLEAYAKIQPLTKSFKQVSLISPEELILDGQHSLYDVWTMDFKRSLPSYLSSLIDCSVRTIEDIIEFNIQNSHVELPSGNHNQDRLILAARTNFCELKRKRLIEHARSIGQERGIDKTLKDNKIDVILAPADSPFSLLVSAAGYASATMPMGYLKYNGRPIGMAAITTANGERTLLKVLSAWEKTFPNARQPPQNLINRKKCM